MEIKNKKEKIAYALGVLSGRFNVTNITKEEYSDYLGFGFWNACQEEEDMAWAKEHCKERAEEIILDAICLDPYKE